MVPLVKFRIFDNDNEAKIEEIQQKLDDVNKRIVLWRNFLIKTKNKFHGIRVSHTDQDMLSITFPIKFDPPVSLEKKALLEKLEITLDLLQKQGLL